MKNWMIFPFCALLLLSGCGSYTGMGAYTGSSIGSVLGSAIGGITGGRHGHDVGTIIGMAGGAIVGGAIGAKADQDRQEGYERARERVEQRPTAPLPRGQKQCRLQQPQQQLRRRRLQQ